MTAIVLWFLCVFTALSAFSAVNGLRLEPLQGTVFFAL